MPLDWHYYSRQGDNWPVAEREVSSFLCLARAPRLPFRASLRSRTGASRNGMTADASAGDERLCSVLAPANGKSAWTFLIHAQPPSFCLAQQFEKLRACAGGIASASKHEQRRRPIVVTSFDQSYSFRSSSRSS